MKTKIKSQADAAFRSEQKMARHTRKLMALLLLARENESCLSEEETAQAVKLVDAGADLSGVSPSGETVLMMAVTYTKEKTPLLAQKIIARGVDVNAPDAEGDTPLIRAALLDKPVILQALLDAGADVFHRNASDRSIWDMGMMRRILFIVAAARKKQEAFQACLDSGMPAAVCVPGRAVSRR